MNHKEKIKVVEIVPSLTKEAGVPNSLLNYLRCINHDEFEISVVTHSLTSPNFVDELQSMGIAVYYANYPSVSQLGESIKQLRNIYSTKLFDYDIAHCHAPNLAFMHFPLAKYVGISSRIIHSHLASSSDIFTHRIRNYPLNIVGKKYATCRAACSKTAGDYLFKNESYSIITNAVDCQKLRFNNEVRAEIRSSMGILEETLAIGCIGRFVPQKNQQFAVSILSKYLDSGGNAVLVFAGTGPLENNVKSYAEQNNVLDNCKFLGVRSNLHELYQAFDVLVMPSLFEGLPVVGVEAQASGLNPIFSDAVSVEANVTGGAKFISLSHLDDWVASIQELQGDRLAWSERFLESVYNIKNSVCSLENLYRKLATGEKNSFDDRRF